VVDGKKREQKKSRSNNPGEADTNRIPIGLNSEINGI